MRSVGPQLHVDTVGAVDVHTPSAVWIMATVQPLESGSSQRLACAEETT